MLLLLVYISGLSKNTANTLPASALAAPLAGVGPCPPAGSPEVLCGTDTQEPAPFAHGACGWLACGSLALSALARVARPSGRGV